MKIVYLRKYTENFVPKNLDLSYKSMESATHCYFTRLNLKNEVTLILPSSIARNSLAPNAKSL